MSMKISPRRPSSYTRRCADRPYARRPRPSGCSPSAAGKLFPRADALDPLDDALHNPLGRRRSLRRRRSLDQSLHRLVGILLVIRDERRVERLARASSRRGKGRSPSGRGARTASRPPCNPRPWRSFGMFDGLGDRARNEGLRRRHHADVALDREIPLTDPSAGIGAIEDRVMLGLQERRAFQRHRPADMGIGGFDVLLAVAEERQQLEGRVGELLGRDLEVLGQEVVAEGPAVKTNLMSKADFSPSPPQRSSRR